MGKKSFDLGELLKSIDRLYKPAGEPNIAEVSAEEAQQLLKYSKEELEQMEFGEAQIEEIRTGVCQQLPVQCYARTCYNWRQMREIRIGLLEHLDINTYKNDLFSAEQMRQIRMGLQDRLLVSSYANLMFSAKDMALARKTLLSEAYLSSPVGHAKTVEDRSGVKIRISDNCMQAYMTLPKGKSFSAHELARILNRNDVVSGILEEKLKKAEQGSYEAEEVLIAEGRQATTGSDGRYEYFFNPLLSDAPTMHEDGSVDYEQIIVADKKNPGDLLARYYPAQAGEDGETVTGISIAGKNGKEKPALYGKGVIHVKEKNLYLAKKPGYVVLDEKEGIMNVWDIYVVDNDVNRYNGNISYDGIIHIRGSVGDMANIEASGNVVVQGYVQGASIRAGGNIVLQSGMNGGGRGFLEAGGSITGKFFEAAEIHARGNVEGDYFLNCSITTDASVIAKQAKSRIVGGSIRAGYSVETYSVIRSGRPATAIEVGNSAWLDSRLKETVEKLSQSKRELKQLNEGKEKVSAMTGAEAQQQKELLKKIVQAIQVKEEEILELNIEVQHRERVRKRAKGAYIQVFGNVQAGVTLSVCGKIRRVDRDLHGAVTFRTEGA